MRGDDVTDQVRVDDTTTSRATPSTTTLMLLPAGTLTRPLIVGVADAVDTTEPPSITIAGAIVSTVTFCHAVRTLPTASCTFATTGYTVDGSEWDVTDQVPGADTVPLSV